jgi:hypothetical protein
MRTTVDGIEHFYKLMNVNIHGVPVSKDIFEEETQCLNLIRESYCNAFQYKETRGNKTYIIGYKRLIDGQYFLVNEPYKSKG